MIKVYDRVNNKSNHTYLSVCLFNTNEIFSVEDWLKKNHREVYDSYESHRYRSCGILCLCEIIKMARLTK